MFILLNLTFKNQHFKQVIAELNTVLLYYTGRELKKVKSLLIIRLYCVSA
jgi:hypothetical protein